MATCNVQTLLDSAACFDCLSPGLKRALELQLLCEILSAGGGGGTGTVTSVSVATANGVSGSVATATTTPAITLTLNAITPTSVALAGSAGAGFVGYPTQSSPPAAPASGFVKYADSLGRMAWRRASDGFVRTISSTLTANRVYTWPDADSIMPIASQQLTFSGPTAARTITLPDANFTAARTDAAQTFFGVQTIGSGLMYIGNAGGSSPYLFNFLGNSDSTPNSSGLGLSIYNYAAGNNEYGVSFRGASVTATSGDSRAVHVSRVFAPTSGTATWSQMSIRPTINQTGGANGITRGLYINPVITAAADFRSLEVTAGKSLFSGDVELGSSSTLNWNADTIFLRDAAGSLSLRNGTNGQRFRVFNTYSGTSDEWFEVDWQTAATKVRLGSNKSGSGSTRIVEIIVGGTAAAQWDSSNNFYPVTNNGPSCGISSNRWNALWAQTKVQIGASGADVILTGEATGVLQLGQDAGTPAAQRIKAFDGSGTNIAGSDLEVGGGQGTGTGIGGSFIVKGSPAGSSGSSLNAYQNNFIVTAAGDIQTQKTVTAGGTTGAQTINKPTGSVNFAAAATSLVVTNSFVTTSSVIIATVATNDATMKSVNVVAGSGSFTINANAAATAETRVNFIIRN